MPMLDYRRLKTTPEYRRAFLVLCMISHGYVWGKHEKTSEVWCFSLSLLPPSILGLLVHINSDNFFPTHCTQTLPANLAVPWTGIANHLGLCPVVCNAAVVLWNYRLLDEDGPIDLR